MEQLPSMTHIKNLEQRITHYWNSIPCNSLNSNTDNTDIEYFKQISRNRYFVESHIPTFAEFNKSKGLRVLEIGCGIGTDAAEFARHGANYTGIDISSNSIDMAKRRFELENLEGQFCIMNASDLKSLELLGKFDLIYSFGVLHHYPEINQIIDNIQNCLVNDGKFKFMVYARNSWKYAMIQHGLDQYEAQPDCPFAEVYTAEDIQLLLDKKFKINTIKQAHCFMYNVEKYKQYIYELEPWFQSMSIPMRDAIQEQLGWHLLIEASKI